MLAFQENTGKHVCPIDAKEKRERSQKREIFGDNDAKEERERSQKGEISDDNDAKEEGKVAKEGNFW